MFTRLQTVYLFLALVLLSLGLFTSTIFSFVATSNKEQVLDFKISGFSIAYEISKPVATISDENLQALRDQPESTLLVENNIFHWKGARHHWFFVPGIAVLILLILAFINYKTPAKQIRFVRIALFMGLILIILLIFTLQIRLAFIGFANDFSLLDHVKLGLNLGMGYVLLVLHVPFIFLAQLSIKRDKNLLDSLHRLR
jgi:hypothetical protein